MDLNNSFLHLMATDADQNFDDEIEVMEEQLAFELKALGGKVKPEPDDLRDKLEEIGSLLSDDDVLFALRNLKQIGSLMRKRKRTLFEVDQGKSNAEDPLAMSPPTIPVHEIKTEDGHSPSGRVTRSNSALAGVKSPPAKVFQGMKRLNETALASSLTVKRRRTGSTPSRPKNSTPSRQTPGVEHCTSHAEAKCKASDLGNAFLKSKKLTKSSSTTIYNAIKEKGRDVVEFECGTESFYKIMTHYFPALSMTPEDVRYKELKKNLFTFVMSRTEYMQVITFLNLAYICIEKLLTI